jgi:hypothetical protein
MAQSQWSQGQNSMKPFFYLRYLNILEVVGLFIKEGIACEVVPTDKEHARIHFDSDDIGNMAI